MNKKINQFFTGKTKPPLLPKPCLSSSTSMGEHIIPQMIITSPDDVSEEIETAAKNVPVIAITESETTPVISDVSEERNAEYTAVCQTAIEEPLILSSEEIRKEEQLQNEDELSHSAIQRPLVIESEKSINIQDPKYESDPKVPVQAPTAMQRPLVFDGSKPLMEIEPDSMMVEDEEQEEAELQLVFNASAEAKNGISSSLGDKIGVSDSGEKCCEEMKSKPLGFLKKHGFPSLHFGGKDSIESHTEKQTTQFDDKKETKDGQHGIKHFFTSLIHEPGEDKYEKHIKQEKDLESPKEETHDLKHGVKKFFDSFKQDPSFIHEQETAKQKKQDTNLESPKEEPRDLKHGVKKFFDSFKQDTFLTHEQETAKHDKNEKQDLNLESPKEESRDLKHGVKKFFDSFKQDTSEQSHKIKSSEEYNETELPFDDKVTQQEHKKLPNETEQSEGKHKIKRLFSFKYEKTPKEKSGEHTENLKGSAKEADETEQPKESKHGIMKIFDSFTHKEAVSKSSDDKQIDGRNEHIYDDVRSPESNQDEFIRKHKEGPHGVKKLFDSFRSKDANKQVETACKLKDERGGKKGDIDHNFPREKVNFDVIESTSQIDTYRKIDSSNEQTHNKEQHKEGGHSFKQFFGSKEKDSSKLKSRDSSVHKDSEIPDAQITFDSLIEPEDSKPSIFSSLKPKFLHKEKGSRPKEEMFIEKAPKTESKIQEYDLQNAGTSEEFPEHVVGRFKPLPDFSIAEKITDDGKKGKSEKVARPPIASVEVNGFDADVPVQPKEIPKSKEPGTPESLYETCCVRLAVLLRNKALDIVTEHTKSPPKKPPKPSAEALAKARAAAVEKRVQELQKRHPNFGDDLPIGINGIRYADDETESSGDYKDVENLDYIMDYGLVNRYKFDNNKLDTFSVPSTCSGMTSYYTADTATLKDENFSDNALETISLDSSDSYVFKNLPFVQAKSDLPLEHSLKGFPKAAQKEFSVSHMSSDARPQSVSPTSGQSAAPAGTKTKRVPPPIPPKPTILPKSINTKFSSPNSASGSKVTEISQCVNSLSLSPRLSVKGKKDTAGTQKRPLTIAGVKETEFSTLRKANGKGLALKDRKFDTVLKNESLRNLPSIGLFQHSPLTATKSSPPQLAITKSSPDISISRKISPKRPPPPTKQAIEQSKTTASASPKPPEKPKRDGAATLPNEKKEKRTASPKRDSAATLPNEKKEKRTSLPKRDSAATHSNEKKEKRTASPPRPPPPVLKQPVQSPAASIAKSPVQSPSSSIVKSPVRSPPPRPPPPVLTSSSPASSATQQITLQSATLESSHICEEKRDILLVNGETLIEDEILKSTNNELQEKVNLSSGSISEVSKTPIEEISVLDYYDLSNQIVAVEVDDNASKQSLPSSCTKEILSDNEKPIPENFQVKELPATETTQVLIQSVSQSSETCDVVKPPQRKPKPPPRIHRIRSRTVDAVPSEKICEPKKRRSQSLSDVEERVCSLEKLPEPEKVELKHLYTAVNKNGKRGHSSLDAELNLEQRSSSLDKLPSRPLPAPPPPPRKFRSLGRKPKEREKLSDSISELNLDSKCDMTVNSHVKPPLPLRHRKVDKERFHSLGCRDIKSNVERIFSDDNVKVSRAFSAPPRPERRLKHHEARYDENANVSFPVAVEVHHSEHKVYECENEVFDLNANQNIPRVIESELPVERISENIVPRPREKKPNSNKIKSSSWYDESDISSPKPVEESWELLDWRPSEIVEVKHYSNVKMRRRSDPVKKIQHASTFYVDVKENILSSPLAVDKETSPLPLDCSEKSVQTSLETLSRAATSSRDEQSDDTDELLDLAQTLQNELKTIITRHKTNAEYNDSEDSQTPPLSAEDRVTLSCPDKKVKKNDSVRSSTSELWQMTSSEESEGELAHGGTENLTEIALTRKQKRIFYVAQELMTSEEVFVDALKLLNVDFKAAVEAANKQRNTHVIPDEILCQILNHLPQLQHLNENLLMELKDRIDNWEKFGKIADIIVKMGPFLKLYSWFIHDFESTVALLEESKKKYPLFAHVVSEFERSSRCKRLTLNHFLLKPIQRIPQYRLLLQEYRHHLPEDSPDYQDTITAIQIVSEVANHANESMKQGDNVQKLFSIQNSILGHKEIIKPGRIFIKEGELMKLSRKGMQPRWFVLLNDMLLYLTPVQQGLYRVNHELALTGMKVAIPIQQDYQNEFSIISVTRSFTLASKSPEERQEWIIALTKAIEENASKRSTFTNVRLQQRSQNKTSEEEEETFVLGRKAPVWIPDARVTMCQLCTSEFTVTFRRHHCRACGKVVCSICSSNRISLPYLGNRIARVCDECHIKIGPGSGGCTESGETDSDNQQIAIKSHLRTDRYIKKGRRNLPSVLKEVCANDQGSTISGYLQIRSGKNWKRDWFVIKDKVIYEYRASEDVAALRSVPLLGYQIESFDEPYEGIDSSLLIKLTHPGQAPIIFYADTTSSMERWVAALKEASVLE